MKKDLELDIEWELLIQANVHTYYDQVEEVLKNDLIQMASLYLYMRALMKMDQAKKERRVTGI